MFDINDILRGSSAFYIDNEGKDHPISKEEAIIKILEEQFTVKIEGMEYLYPESNSVHMFVAPEGAVSFDVHTDLVDLKILCINGTKSFEVDSRLHTLKEKEFVLVNKGIPHRAINNKASIILSIEL